MKPMQPIRNNINIPYYNAFMKLFGNSDKIEYNNEKGLVHIRGRTNRIVSNILTNNLNDLNKCILDIKSSNEIDDKAKDKAIYFANKLLETKEKHENSIKNFEEFIGDYDDLSTIRATSLFIKSLMESKDDALIDHFTSIPQGIISPDVKEKAIRCLKNSKFKARLNDAKNVHKVVKSEVAEGAEAFMAKELQSLDTVYLNIGMHCWYPMKIPTIVLTPDEEQHIDEAYAKIEELENSIKSKYENEIDKFNWHGRTSFQRLVWQDEGFLKAIQDPLIIKAILIKAKNKKETPLKKDIGTLSELMLYALGSNQISYLITAAPNFYNRPINAGAEWKNLKDMVVHCFQTENPKEITQEYLQNANKAFASLKNVLNEHFPPHGSIEAKSIENEALHKMSVSELIDKLNAMIDTDEKIFEFTYSAAGAKTRPGPMAAQCFEVMMDYNNLLKHHGGDHSKVLGYGLISHALDAKHLAAALYCVKNPKSKVHGFVVIEYDNRLAPGFETFSKLINDAKEGKLDPMATMLLKIRLQQMVSLVTGLKNK